ncbi:MAG: serine acetyltransferase [Pedobacter sp.]|nr:MAG: serine acetyltransferase [Pedobacter sp.]
MELSKASQLKSVVYNFFDRLIYQGPFQDWRANKGNLRSRLILILFRLATFFRKHKLLAILFIWYLVLYRIVIEWILHIELNWHVKSGKNLKLTQGHGIVIQGSTVLGNNCTIRHHTTIGHKMLSDGTWSSSPKIGNNVDIGVNVTIIGDIEIGDNVTIGAGAVVTKSVLPNCVMVGNPAKLLKMVYTQHSIV